MKPLDNNGYLQYLTESLIQKKEQNIRIQKELSIIRNNSNLRKFLSNRLQVPDDPHQILYTISNPKTSGLCTCGKLKAFINYSKGYAKTCGAKECISINRLSTLRKNTFIKYGVDHPTKLQSTKDQYKKTMLALYGVDHNWKGTLRETGEKTSMKLYGVKHALQNKEIHDRQQRTTMDRNGTINMFSLEKTKLTNIKVYGFENAAKNRGIIEKIQVSNKRTSMRIANEKLAKFEMSIVEYLPQTQTYKLKCDRCGGEFIAAGCTVNSKLRMNIDPCIICNRSVISMSSNLEKQIANFVIENYEANEILLNCKSVLKKSEIDIYVKDLKIGIEVNGTYWHSEMEKSEEYHFDKSQRALSSGIRIFNVWEDDWKLKPAIVKSMILNWLGKSAVTYARKYECSRIPNSTAYSFCEENHLKGGKYCTVAFGLSDKAGLASVMTFTRKNERWEVDRLCTKLGISVIGGASKLLTAFVREFNPETLISYCDIDISPDPTRSVYSKLGFILERRTSSHSWVIDGIRMNRMNFMKHKLVDKDSTDTRTAVEIMHDAGRYRTFECGNWLFTKNYQPSIDK